jgi:hypothetical protein
MSFFGGDINKAHFAVGVSHRLPSEAYGKPGYGKDKQRRINQIAKLKALGFKLVYRYEFTVGDEVGKAAAKAKADAKAKQIGEAVGFKLEVCEGCFL